MRSHARPAPRQRSWLFTVLAILAMAAQIAVALGPLGESRESQLASHVEAGGTRSHVSHSEATCPSCQARSIHGNAPRAAEPLFIDIARGTTFVAAIDHIPSVEAHPRHHPRAPPFSVI